MKRTSKHFLLEIVMTEDDDNFFELTLEFLAMVSNFPKYEGCYYSFQSKYLASKGIKMVIASYRSLEH